MSRGIINRLERLEAARTDITTTMTVRRRDDDTPLFSRTIRYLDPAQIHLRWPEREEVVESIGAHCEELLLGRSRERLQHRCSNDVI